MIVRVWVSRWYRGWSLCAGTGTCLGRLRREEKRHVCDAQRQQGHAHRKVPRGRSICPLIGRFRQPALDREQDSRPTDQPMHSSIQAQSFANVVNLYSLVPGEHLRSVSVGP